MARLLAPILSHTAEEVWGLLQRPAGIPSPQLAEFPKAEPAAYKDVLERWEPFSAVRQGVSLINERARQAGVVENTLSAQVRLESDSATYRALNQLESDLAALFKVSSVHLVERHDWTGPFSGFLVMDLGVLDTSLEGRMAVEVVPAPGVKCARCWLIKEDVGANPAHGDLCRRCADVVERMAGDGR
jgi:isoleucyl-tRNA synthetase